MAGMFGASPLQVQRAQQQQNQGYAGQLADRDGFAAAKYMLAQAGGAAAAPVAGMMGMVNPEMEQAKQAQDIQSQIDHSTPEGLMKGAELFNQAGNPQMAMMYYEAAQAAQAQSAKIGAANAQQQLAEYKLQNPTAGKPSMVTDDSGNVTAVFPDGTTKDIGRIGKTKSQGSAAASPVDKGRWIDADRGGIKGQENTVSGEFKPYPNQDGGTRGTPAQRFKEEQKKGVDRVGLKSMETQLSQLTSAAEALKKHPGVKGISGVQGVFPSVPGGNASQAQVLLDEFRAATKNAGLQLVRQGGSIGAMTEKEWPIVEAMVANLDPSGGAKQLQDQIDKVVAKMQQVYQDSKINYDILYSDTPSGSGASDLPEGAVELK